MGGRREGRKEGRREEYEEGQREEYEERGREGGSGRWRKGRVPDHTAAKHQCQHTIQLN